MQKDELRVSDEAVQKATGRTWEGWLAFLAERNAVQSSHKEIVAHLAEEIDSGWWQQMVANGCEKLSGARRRGESQRGTFQVGVQRTFDVPPETVWNVLTSRAGQATWLGPGADLAFEPGELFNLTDGTTGEVRVGLETGHLRLFREPDGWPGHATLQVRVTPKDEGRSTLSFHEEGLPSAAIRRARRTHFKTAIETIEARLEKDLDAA